MSWIPLYRLPKVELIKIKPIDFFPA